MRGPHGRAGNAQEELLPVLARQVPHPVQTDRRHLPHYIPARVRLVQSDLLVDVPLPGRAGRSACVKDFALSSEPEH